MAVELQFRNIKTLSSEIKRIKAMKVKGVIILTITEPEPGQTFFEVPQFFYKKGSNLYDSDSVTALELAKMAILKEFGK